MIDQSHLEFLYGLGYRYWIDHLDESNSPGGYQRNTSYLYAPIGIRSQHQLNNDWLIQLNVQYNFF